MSNKPGLSKVIVLAIISVVILGIIFFLRFTSTPEGDNVFVPPAAEETTSDEVEYVTIPLETEESTSSIDTSTWVRVPEDGYEFMHPDYYINDNGDHYIMAYEPRIGQEFSAMVIYKPVDIATEPFDLLEQKVADVEAQDGEVLMDPHATSAVEGVKMAYHTQYEIKSGPTTGVNNYYLLQSPHTDKWVVIEHPEHPTAEAIRESFRFMPFQ